MTAKGVNKIEHDECQQMLPAYIKGQLSSDLQRAVQHHVAQCSECFEVQQDVQALGQHMNYTPPELEELLSSTAMERNLDKALTACDQDSENFEKGYVDGESAIRRRKNIREFIESYLGILKRHWGPTPSGMKYLLMAQTAMLLMAVGIIFQIANGPKGSDIVDQGSKTYQTLSNEPVLPATQNRSQDYLVFRVLFHEATSERDIRRLMNSIEGQMISGPSTSGVYTIATLKNSEQQALILNKLRQSPWIRLAEIAVH